MRADSAVSYRQASNESVVVQEIKIGDKELNKDLNLPIDGVSKLDISISINIDSLLDETYLDRSSKFHIVLDAICDNLRVRESIKSWLIPLDQDTWTNPESAVGLLPNALINNGLELEVVVCVFEPIASKSDPLACDFEGGIVFRKRIPISNRGEGPLLPIEYVGRASENDPIWHIELDTSNGLDAPASSSMRVFVSEQTSFANALKSLRFTNENKLATGILIHAIFDEVIRKVMYDEEMILEMSAANKSVQTLNDDHWAKTPSSIGFLINSWTMKLCAGRSLTDLAKEYRNDPTELVKEIRYQFLGKWI
jgi:hypothetical protein